MNKLTATKRSKKDKLADIRSNGMVPAVIYGAQVENTSISVLSASFEKILKEVGETSTITIELEDAKSKTKKEFDVLIHEIQVHPVKGFPLHIDFLAIDKNKPIEVSVPILFEGRAPAEKESLGVLVKVLREFEIEALPKDIPSQIVVDLSSLIDLDAQIHTKNISLPNGVKMITGENEVVALITPIKEEVVEKKEIDLSAIEVEKKGKQEEGEENEKEQTKTNS